LKTKLKYLFTGSLVETGTCDARRNGLIESGREVVAVSFEPFFRMPKWSGRIGSKWVSLQTLTGIGPSIARYNRHLIATVRASKPDVVWVEKGHYVSRATLEIIKQETNAFLVCYNTDDIHYARNGWRLHRPSIGIYDLYFTTNRYNVPELKELGARNVMLTQLGYNRNLFYPCTLTERDKAELGAAVGFIGHWEPATEKVFEEVARRGVPLRIRGLSWAKAKHNQYLKESIEVVSLSKEAYTKAIVATTINLGVNSSQSRNLSSGRSFEIPAAGGFLLAARTTEHQAFYIEGIEAEFFKSAQELAEKALYYLRSDHERAKIAKAGYKKCVSAGYSYQELMVGLVKSIEDSYSRMASG